MFFIQSIDCSQFQNRLFFLWGGGVGLGGVGWEYWKYLSRIYSDVLKGVMFRTFGMQFLYLNFLNL